MGSIGRVVVIAAEFMNRELQFIVENDVISNANPLSRVSGGLEDAQR